MTRDAFPGGHAPCDATGACITCSDMAVPMRVVAAGAVAGIAVCEDPGGAQSEVLTGLVEPVTPGETLLVHAGAALQRVEQP